MTNHSKNRGGAAADRQFGLALALLGSILAAYSVWRHHTWTAVVVGTLALLSGCLALVRPSSLDLPRRVMESIGRPIGWVGQRAFLVLAFFAVLTPLGVLRRLGGHDSLCRRRAAGSSWLAYPSSHLDRDHFERMY